MRNKELTADDLQAILYWHAKAFKDSDEDVDQHKNTLIKIQALAIYAQEDEELSTRFFRRRMR